MKFFSMHQTLALVFALALCACGSQTLDTSAAIQSANPDAAVGSRLVASATCLKRAIFPVNQPMKAQQSFYSCNGLYQLLLQGDSNLVIYAIDPRWHTVRGAIWASNTVGKGADRVIMQSDGNFVMYKANGQPIWSTGTYGNPGAVLALDDYSNLTISVAVGSTAATPIATSRLDPLTPTGPSSKVIWSARPIVSVAR